MQCLLCSPGLKGSGTVMILLRIRFKRYLPSGGIFSALAPLHLQHNNVWEIESPPPRQTLCKCFL